MTLDHVPDDTLARLMHDRAVRQPDAPAILAPGRTPLSYATLWQQILCIGDRLREYGPASALRVAVALPEGPDMAVAFLAVAAHAVCVPLNAAAKAAECRRSLQSSGTNLVIAPRSGHEELHRVTSEMGLPLLILDDIGAMDGGSPSNGQRPDTVIPAGGWPQAPDTALILPTSGTTGQPKMVPLGHRNLMASARQIAAHLALRPDDRCLNVMPLFHVHGLVGALLATMAGGGSIVCTPGFDASDFFDWIADFDPSWITAVPTIHQAIVDHGALYGQVAPGHRFRFIRSSSAALPQRTLQALQALTGAPVIEAYGMTEATHQMCSNPLPPAVRKPGTVGPSGGPEVAIMAESGTLLAAGETGEIVIRGPNVTAGYESNPTANAEAFVNGWFRTGDQGVMDADGYVSITGRLKEIINRGGEKISPREVDEILMDHPAVAQVVCFGMPHPKLGEEVAAVVVLREGQQATERELQEFVAQRAADFKVPKKLLFMTEIPKGATGKLQRIGLAAKLGL